MRAFCGDVAKLKRHIGATSLFYNCSEYFIIEYPRGIRHDNPVELDSQLQSTNVNAPKSTAASDVDCLAKHFASNESPASLSVQ